MNKRILQQAQQLQARIAKMQEELENTTVEASSGGGAVTVVITGQQRICSIKISPQALDVLGRPGAGCGKRSDS